MAILPLLQEIGFEASERLAVSHAGSVEQHSTQSTAAAGQSKSGPQLAARSSLCKQPQPRQRGKKGHSSKTGSKPPNSAKSRSQPSKESTSKQGESSAKQRHQEHGKDTAAARKRGRPCTNTDTKSKRAKSVEKRAPRRDPTPKSSAGQGGLKPAATAKKRKKRRWIIPPALKKLYNINKGAGTAAITGQWIVYTQSKSCTPVIAQSACMSNFSFHGFALSAYSTSFLLICSFSIDLPVNTSHFIF